MTKICNRADGAYPAVCIVEESGNKSSLKYLMIRKANGTELVNLFLINITGMSRYKPSVFAKSVVNFRELVLCGTEVVRNLVYKMSVLPHTAEVVAVGRQAIAAAVV